MEPYKYLLTRNGYPVNRAFDTELEAFYAARDCQTAEPAAIWDRLKVTPEVLEIIAVHLDWPLDNP